MKIALIYGTKSGATEQAALKIRQALGPERVDAFSDVRLVAPRDLQEFDLLILGTPTYDPGRLPEEWNRFLEELEPMKLPGTKIALFSLGNQWTYSLKFADGMRQLYDLLVEKGADGRYGFWSTDGYQFDSSEAVMGDRFCGLVLDEVNQQHLTDERIQQWCNQLREELPIA